MSATLAFLPASRRSPVVAQQVAGLLSLPVEANAVIAKPIAERCENWAEQYRLRKLRGQARSFEGRSRANPFSSEQGAPTFHVDPDVLDAQIIEDAMQLVPLYQHLLLRFHYIRRWSPGKVLREAADGAKVERGEFSGYADSLRMAHALLVGALGVPSAIRKDRVQARVHELVDSLPEE